MTVHTSTWHTVLVVIHMLCCNVDKFRFVGVLTLPSYLVLQEITICVLSLLDQSLSSLLPLNPYFSPPLSIHYNSSLSHWLSLPFRFFSPVTPESVLTLLFVLTPIARVYVVRCKYTWCVMIIHVPHFLWPDIVSQERNDWSILFLLCTCLNLI